MNMRLTTILLEIASKENEAGQANRVIGRAQLMPRINYNYWTAANNLKQSGPPLGGPNQTYNKAYPSDNQTAQLTQPIFDLGALARYQQGVAQGDFAEAKFAYQSQDLLVRTLQAYVDLLFTQRISLIIKRLSVMPIMNR